MADEDTIFLIDVLVLGNNAFAYGLKEILESTEVVKLMFDCRRDSDTLWQEFGVRLTNVLDMQLFEYMVREVAGYQLPTPAKPWHWRRPVVFGLDATVDKYVRSNDKSSMGILDVKRLPS
uniref:3'-5' exonuclease domain-containing protein n=1 Tax=Clytia hemisphaerica TaxID=252671 RepID=A0A7M5UW67_9CNID